MMMGGSRTLAALLASALIAGPALAEPRQPNEKDRQVASDLVKKAIARSQAGDHLAAIEIYNQAYTIVPNSLLLSNIGAEFQQSGMPKEALKYFCMYLEKDPSGTNAPYATSQAKILQRQLGNKKVDERDVCGARQDDEEDDRPSRRHVDPPPSPPPPPTKHEAVERDTGNQPLMYAGVTAGIAGIAAAGIGVYFGLKGKSISDEINAHKMNDPWPDNIRALMKEGDRDNSYQTTALVASGVLLVTGVVLYVVSRPDAAAERSTDKTVHVTPTANGVAVFGRF
jgi:hypothetical protein